MILALILALATTPDPTLTPGALCTPASVGYDGPRAGVAHCRRHVTTSARRTVLARYGVAWARRGTVEIDHLIPLCLGGSNDLENLWAVNLADAKRKDVIEKRLCAQLRAGTITQADGVEEMKRWR